MTVIEPQIDAVAKKIYRDWDSMPELTFEEALRRAVEAGIRLAAVPRAVGLTRAQHDLLAYLRAYIEREGYPPSFDEMREAMGLQSKSGIHRLIEALVERGAIRRLPNRARAIEVIAA